ncbi:hypothetical protein ACOME3_003482 [Neoechinorhynchus agilis]
MTQSEHPRWKPFVWGGVASITAELVSFPFDLTKTRLQLQGQIIDANLTTLKYRGMLHAFVTISREEGPRALYNGLSPAVLRQATYGTLKMGFYNFFGRIFVGENQQHTLFTAILSGMCAGGCAGCIANPTDVLKVRLQAASKTVEKKSMVRHFVDIYEKERFRGLYRGAVQTTQRGAIVTGVELGVYDWAKRMILRRELGKDNIFTHFWASVVAGLAGTIATNPIDVIRTRLMNQRKFVSSTDAAKTIIYKNGWDCVKQTVKNEGYLALYKGFIPLWLRLAPWNTTVCSLTRFYF